MNTKQFSQTLSLCVAAAILTVPMTVALMAMGPQRQTGPSGRLAVVGEVTVNGTNAISGATVFSDSTVTTAKGSSAVVSLGKLGRVEVLPESSVKLTFDSASIQTAMLDSGRVRVSSSSGVGATATTNDGSIVADKSDKNEFTVDTTCGDTLVSVKKGRVELRAGDSVKQIAAGNQDTAGTATPGCRR
ncbi:MAG TPA: hypothetical protein VEW46_09795 [Pyrinomonadaceae bacterium]|nr:hypothetical protein [Pyrinomonadaceae bacterium]